MEDCPKLKESQAKEASTLSTTSLVQTDSTPFLGCLAATEELTAMAPLLGRRHHSLGQQHMQVDQLPALRQASME